MRNTNKWMLGRKEKNKKVFLNSKKKLIISYDFLNERT